MTPCLFCSAINCESHSNRFDAKNHLRSTANLLHRFQIELRPCEKYELRTGFLSRWNYMPKNINLLSPEEIATAINLGYQEELDWTIRCDPDLPPSFILKDWKNCISQIDNPSFLLCKDFLNQELKTNHILDDAFKKSIVSYSERYKTSPSNGFMYVLEEVAWCLSLPLVHPNKHIFLLHVGSANHAIKELFKSFPNFGKTVRWLRPHIRDITFKNNVDFLLYYNANRNVGCSYAADNKAIVDPFINKPAIDDLSLFEIKSSQKILLQTIIEKLPCHVYWLDRANTYVGCNNLQAKSFGLKSRDEVKGKTNFNFHDFSTAKKLNDVNELVMSTQKPYDAEEIGYVLKERKICLSKKIPLFDNLGDVIGLLGISFDITQKKEIECLESKLKLQEDMYKLAMEVAHDICSPLTSLELFQNLIKNKLTEKENVLLSLLKKSIGDISGKLLNKYKTINSGNYIDKKTEEKIDLKVSMREVMERKIFEYSEKNASIKYTEKENSVFIMGDRGDFERMMSNIMNNSLESVEGKKAEIEVTCEEKGEKVEIMVRDNGKGMSEELAEKIKKGLQVKTTKRDGHGTGTQQLTTAIKSMNGNLEINSKENMGTEFIITFPKA